MRIYLTDFEIDKILSALIDKSREDKKSIDEAIKYNFESSKVIFENDRFRCIKLANKINDYLKQNNKATYINIYKECNLSGVELKNYLLWLEKQEA